MQAVSDARNLIPAASRDDAEFRRLLEKLPAAAYTCDPDGLITYYNQHAVDLWGREPKRNDPVDRFCGSFRLFSTDGAPIRHDQCWMARALLENREYDGHEIVVERADGTRVTVLAHANPIRDERGQLSGAVNVLVDITDRKRLEDALRDSERRKDEFLAILAHELRNPLAPLRNALELLKVDGRNGATVDYARGLMERQLDQIVRLVDDLTDVSRIARDKLVLRKERIELAAVVQSAVESTRPLIEALGHELAITIPTEPIWLMADRTRLAQVLSNLLNNAAKFTSRAGRIALGGMQEGNDAVVRIRDNGVGIPREMLPRIFELFTQDDRSLESSRGGLGIGLSLVRGLVEMHGGSVTAGSEGVGRGSEFVVRLPICRPPEYQGSNRSAEDRELAGAFHYRILVVDDSRDAALSLAKLLSLLGNDVEVAHDGLGALELAEALQPEVVLLDIGLPKLNGYDTARAIRRQPWGKAIFLVAVSGWGQDDDKRRSLEAGFNLHMVKPVELNAITGVLAALRQRTRTSGS
jgi:signal transduction histidine kinase/ActR/RegA family two-component response regulator